MARRRSGVHAARHARPCDPALDAEVARRTEQLAKSRRQLAEAQRVARIGSWELDLASGRLAFSDELVELYGFAPGSGALTLEDLRTRILPSDRAAFDRHLQLVRDLHQPYELDHRVVHPDGTELTLFVRGQIVRDELGTAVRAIGTTQDVTALRRTQAELRRAIERLEQSDRYKDDFLSVISHELRTPLNFITGFASLLQDEVSGGLNSAQHQYVDRILLGAERLQGLVDNLLDMSRLVAGQYHVVPAPTDYPTLVAAAIALQQGRADGKGIRLETDVDVPGEVMLDAESILKVVANLVDNAIKFTPEGGKVQVKAHRHGGELVTQVVDTGIGIAPENIPELFTRFHQVDMTSTRTAGGTGLGLAVCEGIVQAHGGRIGVVSELGHGSTFWFSLPLSPSPEGEAPPA